MEPAVAKVYEAGAEAVQPAAPAAGEVVLSVSMYPVTPMLSVAVKLLIATVRDAAVAGIMKTVIAGAVVSGRVMVTDLLIFGDILPAASLAQA